VTPPAPPYRAPPPPASPPAADPAWYADPPVAGGVFGSVGAVVLAVGAALCVRWRRAATDRRGMMLDQYALDTLEESQLKDLAGVSFRTTTRPMSTLGGHSE